MGPDGPRGGGGGLGGLIGNIAANIGQQMGLNDADVIGDLRVSLTLKLVHFSSHLCKMFFHSKLRLDTLK